jgi:hypothetical protein
MSRVISMSPPVAGKGERRVVHDLVAEERVALDLEVVVADVARHVERCRRVVFAVVSGTAALQVEGTELAPLDIGRQRTRSGPVRWDSGSRGF